MVLLQIGELRDLLQLILAQEQAHAAGEPMPAVPPRDHQPADIIVPAEPQPEADAEPETETEPEPEPEP